MTVVTRFCPSPTGALHVGNLRTALLSACLARGSSGGRFVVRLEDTDRARSTDALGQAMLAELRWLGLTWEEGPDVGGPHGPYRQSEREAVYQNALERLAASGQAYRCFCTEATLKAARAEQRAHGLPPRYPGTCRDVATREADERAAKGEPFVWRFRVPTTGTMTFDDAVRGPQNFPLASLGDFVLQRTDGQAGFLLTNAVDDAMMGITHVVRGEDHVANTPRQLLILDALGWSRPCYAHVPLMVAAHGKPLSKRDGGFALEGLRSEGFLPDAIVNTLLRVGVHWNDEDGLLSLQALAKGFELGRVSRSPGQYNPEHLRRWQKCALDRLDGADFWSWCAPAVGADVPSEHRDLWVTLVRCSCIVLDDARTWAHRCFAATLPEPDQEPDADPAFYQAILDALPAPCHEGWDAQAWLSSLPACTGRRGKRLFMPLRLALTGVAYGPQMADLCHAMGAWGQLRPRLEAALAHAVHHEGV